LPSSGQAIDLVMVAAFYKKRVNKKYESGVEAVPDDLSPNNSQSENSDYTPASTGLSVCP